MIDQNKQAVDIKGYRVLTDDEKAAMNELKRQEQFIHGGILALRDAPGANQRSLDLAWEHLQTGFMWAVRAIARPNGE